MKKWDVAIIVLVALLSLSPLLLLRRPGADARVVVRVNGETVYEAPINVDAVIPAGSGNIVSVQGGRVTMGEADCPDKLCLHGEATPLHPLVCLPNRVVVTVESGEEAFDGLSY